jgi:Fic family protein
MSHNMKDIIIDVQTGERFEIETPEDEILVRQQMAADYAASITYVQKRIAEYPPITEYIDGVVKGDQAQIDKYIADCLAVKAKYPKIT